MSTSKRFDGGIFEEIGQTIENDSEEISLLREMLIKRLFSDDESSRELYSLAWRLRSERRCLDAGKAILYADNP